jgi:nuclear-control-of-ATPase protein 2
MSVVADFVKRLDAQTDNVPLTRVPLASALRNDTISEADLGEAWARVNSTRAKELHRTLKELSVTESSNPLLSAHVIRNLLCRSKLVRGPPPKSPTSSLVSDGVGFKMPAPEEGDSVPDESDKDPFEEEIEWLIVRKATMQIQALVFRALLDEILPLEEHIRYWDDIGGSSWHMFLLLIQTFPGRAFTASHQLLRDAWARRNARGMGIYAAIKFEWQWRSIDSIRRKAATPIQEMRRTAKARRTKLQDVLEARATALGQFLSSASNGHDHTESDEVGIHIWQSLLESRIRMIEVVLGSAELDSHKLRTAMTNVWPVSGGTLPPSTEEATPTHLARRLVAIIDKSLSKHSKDFNALIADSRKPSILVRYWLPVTVGILSSSTIVRFLFNHRASIVTLISESGATIRDFWFNWVVEPVHRMVNTIRRQPGSEVAVTQASLLAERESLERMVVDFVRDHPHYVEDGLKNVSDSQLAEIRTKVMEGDITPVLRAYEYGLKKPFQRAIRGELIESLLIRVQKVEVMLEATIKGVDSLLEQQQLLFGVIGLAPGMLAVGGAYVYLRRALSAPSARSVRDARQGAVAKIRFMREATRLIASAAKRPADWRQGLLLVEVHRLRALIRGSMPGEVEKMLWEDLDELIYTIDEKAQATTLDRIWKVYYGP